MFHNPFSENLVQYTLDYLNLTYPNPRLSELPN